MPVATSPSDAELITRARSGDEHAYRDLRARHVAAARRLVKRLGRFGSRGDDLVDEAFAIVHTAIQRGFGPDVAFRTYLFTALRWVAAQPADRTAPLALIATEAPPPGEGLANAYESLPERSRTVLWHTDVEGSPPAAVEAHLGLSATEVAALAYRSRERLRQTYITTLIDAEPSDSCLIVHERIEAHTIGALTAGEQRRVDRHLETCAACADLAAELSDLRSALARAVGPRYLGSAAGSYLSGGSSAESPDPDVEPAIGRLWSFGLLRVGVAAATVLIAGMLTWMVYGASAAGVADDAAAIEAESGVEAWPTAEPDHGPRAAEPAGADVPASPPPETAVAPAPADVAPSTDPAAAIEPPVATVPPGASSPPSSSPPPPPAPPPPPSPPSPTPPLVVVPPVISTTPQAAPSADLAVTISGNGHGSANVVINVYNVGPHAAASPTVDVSLRRLPRQVPSGCTMNQGQLSMSCSLGALPSGRQGRISVAVVDGTDVVGLRVLSNTADPTPANNLWSVAPGALTLDRSLS